MWLFAATAALTICHNQHGTRNWYVRCWRWCDFGENNDVHVLAMCSWYILLWYMWCCLNMWSEQTCWTGLCFYFDSGGISSSRWRSSGKDKLKATTPTTPMQKCLHPSYLNPPTLWEIEGIWFEHVNWDPCFTAFFLLSRCHGPCGRISWADSERPKTDINVLWIWIWISNDFMFLDAQAWLWYLLILRSVCQLWFSCSQLSENEYQRSTSRHFAYSISIWRYMHITIPYHASLCISTCCLVRKNLCQLVQGDEDDAKSAPTWFWRWLAKQKWRKMLPQPVQLLATCMCVLLFVRGIVHNCVQQICDINMHYRCWDLLGVGPASRLRVDVVLCDPSRLEHHFVGKWDMFLPSDMTPGSKICAHYIVWGFVLTLFLAKETQQG